VGIYIKEGFIFFSPCIAPLIRKSNALAHPHDCLRENRDDNLTWCLPFNTAKNNVRRAL
jgi:hypothetical protein